MKALDARAALRIWELGADQHRQARSLLLLRAAQPERETPGALPLGERDRLLLELHAAWCGDEIEAVDACPACGERVETTLSVRSLLDGVPLPGPTHFTLNGTTVRFRPMCTDDLLAAADAPDADAAARVLRQRCVLDLSGAGGALDVNAMDEVLVAELSRRLDEADPLAEVLLELVCPACDRRWQSLLEIGEHLWAAVTRQARATLGEVHALASRYGWTEAEILDLSPIRRRFYLGAVSA